MTRFNRPTPVQHGVLNGTQYAVYGAGTPVVLIHGVGLNQDAWGCQIDTLSAGHCVITYDTLGHGGSALPPDEAALHHYADQLHQLLNDLRVDQAVFIGHSMGALIAIEYATRHPERTLGVAALNAVFQRSPEQRAAVQARVRQMKEFGGTSLVDSTLERWFGNPVPEHHRDAAQALKRVLETANPVGYQRSYQVFAGSDTAHAHTLGSIAAPTLFVTGEFDPNSTPAMSQTMASLAQNGSVYVMPNEKHMLTLTSPDLANRILLEFLTRITVTGSTHNVPG